MSCLAFVSQIGDGYCDNFGNYKLEVCGFDGGDCLIKKNYTGCKGDISLIRNGVCDGNIYNTPECDFDGGDCAAFNLKYPLCKGDVQLQLIGDGACDSTSGPDYNTQVCGFDGGDCIEFNRFTQCIVPDSTRFLDGLCDGGVYNTEGCGFDGGDCNDFNTMYPNCVVEIPIVVGDGVCNGTEYNVSSCGYDGGDCCVVRDEGLLGNGICNGMEYNVASCYFDDGDCIFFNTFPNCSAANPEVSSERMHCIAAAN